MDLLPIVFVPGLMCDGALFAHQIARFESEREVFIADLSSQSSIADFASQLLREAPESRFLLAGLSMGGIVSFEVFRQAPERIAGLVLMNTRAEADTPEKTKDRLRQIQRVRAGELTEMVLQELKPNYLAEHSCADQAVLEEICAMAERLGEEVFIRQAQALIARADSVPTLALISCPTAFVAGSEDQLCPPELHEDMHRQTAGSRLHVIENCGHLSTLEQPDLVNQIILDLLVKAEKTQESL